MESLVNMKYVANALVFAVVGIMGLAVSFWVFDRLTPGNLWKEIVEEKNVALAIVVGAMTVGLAQIIAAAIHG